MGGSSFFTALFDVLQRMPPAFERTVHYEPDVVFEAVFENVVNHLAHTLLKLFRVIPIVAFEQITVGIDIDKEESALLGIEYR